MLRSALLAVGLLFAAAGAQAGEKDAAQDTRYPVTVTPSEALAQKEKMRQSLVALRHMLAALADKNFAAVEKAVPELGHGDFKQTVVPTTVYQKMDEQFREASKKVADAARTHDTDAVLRELSATMGWCQSCHGSMRQEVVPADPESGPADK